MSKGTIKKVAGPLVIAEGMRDARNGKLIVCKVASGDNKPRWHYA